MKKIALVLCLALILCITGCGKESTTVSSADEKAAKEITENSKLSIDLLEKVELDEKQREKVKADQPYYSEKSEDKIEGFGFPFPEENSDVYITQITVHSKDYNILGLTVGDKLKKVKKTMKEYEFKRNKDYPSYYIFDKGSAHISVRFDSNQKVEMITVSIAR